MDELELKLKDLILKVLLKWRIVLLCMAVGMVAFGALGAVSAKKSAETTPMEKMSAEQLAEQLEIMRNIMSEEDIKMTEISVAMCEIYQNQYNSAIEYSEASIVFGLDCQRIPTTEMLYYVRVNGDKTGESANIVQTFMWEIHSENMYNAILEEMQWDRDVSYIKELIQVVTESEGTFKVSVIAQNEETSRKIASIISEHIDKIENKLEKMHGAVEIIKFEEQYGECVNEDILTKQQNYMTNLLSLKDKMVKLEEELSGQQMSYYNTLIRYDEVSQEGNSVSIDNAEGKKSNLLNVKYIVLGAVAGAFLACIYEAIMYLFSTKLRRKEDLEEVYGTTILGCLESKEKGEKVLAGVDKFLYTLLNGKSKNANEEIQELICTNVEVICEKNDIHSLCFIGSINDTEAEQMKQNLCEKLADKIESVQYAGSVVSDAESLSEMTKADAVIIVEKEEESKTSDIKRQIELCELHGVHIIGSVVLY